MSKIEKEDVIKKQYDFLTVKEYCDKFGGGLSSQAVYYAMDNGLIDYMAPARERFVVMTEHTKNYVPNSSPKRAGKKKGKVYKSTIPM